MFNFKYSILSVAVLVVLLVFLGIMIQAADKSLEEDLIQSSVARAPGNKVTSPVRSADFPKSESLQGSEKQAAPIQSLTQTKGEKQSEQEDIIHELPLKDVILAQ